MSTRDQRKYGQEHGHRPMLPAHANSARYMASDDIRRYRHTGYNQSINQSVYSEMVAKWLNS